MPKLIGTFLALLVLLITPATASDVTLTGTVTYRERIALPPQAMLRVTLVELGTARPVVGASAGIAAKGSVPVDFTLSVRSNVISQTRAYGLLAEISSQGRVLFRNIEPVPVDPSVPAPVEILVSFSPDPPRDPLPEIPMAPPGLVDVVWTVTSIGGRPASGTQPLTLSIAADHRVGGSGGCNNYFAEASLDGDGLIFGPTAATNMACAPAIQDQEAGFFAALAAVASFEIEGRGLRLLDAAGIPLIGLVRAE